MQGESGLLSGFKNHYELDKWKNGASLLSHQTSLSTSRRSTSLSNPILPGGIKTPSRCELAIVHSK